MERLKDSLPNLWKKLGFTFQFLMVRLKVSDTFLSKFVIFSFQFLMVRLKVGFIRYLQTG